jgi:hypothetical protein
MKRTAYFREWRRRHPVYRMAIGRPARAFYREILGIRVRVNLLGTLRSSGNVGNAGNSPNAGSGRQTGKRRKMMVARMRRKSRQASGKRLMYSYGFKCN